MARGEESVESFVVSRLEEIESLVADWAALASREPLLAEGIPPRADPPLATALIRALVRPQDIEFDGEDDVQEAARRLALTVPSARAVVLLLMCLGEVIAERVARFTAGEVREKLYSRLRLLVHRSSSTAVGEIVALLEAESRQDPLTGLRNRRALDYDLAEDIEAANRDGEGLSIIVADLDGLKQVNDSQGHPAGDELLRSFARGLTDVCPPGWTPYRAGEKGDEFIVVARRASLEEAQGVMTALVSRPETPAFSWGPARYPEEADGTSDLFQLADERMRAMKAEHQSAAERPGDIPSTQDG
jgi:diguanylate cyclase (GGDEF)-like protein